MLAVALAVHWPCISCRIRCCCLSCCISCVSAVAARLTCFASFVSGDDGDTKGGVRTPKPPDRVVLLMLVPLVLLLPCRQPAFSMSSMTTRTAEPCLCNEK